MLNQSIWLDLSNVDSIVIQFGTTKTIIIAMITIYRTKTIVHEKATKGISPALETHLLLWGGNVCSSDMQCYS